MEDRTGSSKTSTTNCTVISITDNTVADHHTYKSASEPTKNSVIADFSKTKKEGNSNSKTNAQQNKTKIKMKRITMHLLN